MAVDAAQLSVGVGDRQLGAVGGVGADHDRAALLVDEADRNRRQALVRRPGLLGVDVLQVIGHGGRAESAGAAGRDRRNPPRRRGRAGRGADDDSRARCQHGDGDGPALKSSPHVPLLVFKSASCCGAPACRGRPLCDHPIPHSRASLQRLVSKGKRAALRMRQFGAPCLHAAGTPSWGRRIRRRPRAAAVSAVRWFCRLTSLAHLPGDRAARVRGPPGPSAGLRAIVGPAPPLCSMSARRLKSRRATVRSAASARCGRRAQRRLTPAWRSPSPRSRRGRRRCCARASCRGRGRERRGPPGARARRRSRPDRGTPRGGGRTS